MGWIETPIWLVLIVPLISIGVTTARPAMTALLSQRTSENHQGLVLGLSNSLLAIATIVFPFIAGLCVEFKLFRAWAWLLTVCCLLSAAIFQRFVRSLAHATPIADLKRAS